MYFTLQSTSIGYFAFCLSSSVSFDVILFVCVFYISEWVFSLLIYLRLMRLLSVIMRPHAHSKVAAANMEDLSHKTCYCLTRETYKGSHPDETDV